MLSQSVSQQKPKDRASTVRFILQSVDGLYFRSTPAFPRLTKQRSLAREFADELLADAFRETIEIRSGRSFTIFCVAGRF